MLDLLWSRRAVPGPVAELSALETTAPSGIFPRGRAVERARDATEFRHRRHQGFDFLERLMEEKVNEPGELHGLAISEI